MIRPLLHSIAHGRRSFMIQSPDGKDYLNRIAIAGDLPKEPATRKVNVFLHQILMNDLDRHLHNHPWEWSYSLILSGGYTEERLTPGGTRQRRMRPGMVNKLGPHDFHRILELHGEETWTLFIGGPKTLGWGFLVPEIGFVSESIYRKVFELDRKRKAYA